MSSPQDPDHRGVKQNITRKLSSSLRALQLRYVTTDDAITSEDDAANALCVALEAVFIHGLKIKFIRAQTDRRRHKGHRGPLPQPAFWPLLKAITHRDVISQLEAIGYITSEVGRCRSWLRLALNESLLECYFLTLQREKCRLAEYYQPPALLLDAEDCAVVLSYLQGLSSLIFSLSYKSSVLNEWTASPLTLSGLWPEEHMVQYEPLRRKSLDSVSQSSGSDDTDTSVISDRKQESSSLSLDNGSSSSQLSSSLGSDEQPPASPQMLPRGPSASPQPMPRGPSASPQMLPGGPLASPQPMPRGPSASTQPMPRGPSVSPQPPPLPDSCAAVPDAAIGDVIIRASHTTSPHHLPIPQVPKADEKLKEMAAPDASVTTPIPENNGDFLVPESPSTPADASHVPAPDCSLSVSTEASPTAELPKSQSWISEDDFHTEPPGAVVDEAGVVGPEPRKPPAAAFQVVHRRQTGLPNPFRGLLMLGTLERKNALGLYKPYVCELTPYELRLQVEGDEQSCAESCSLLRCESVGPALADGRFELHFPNKRLYLRAPSKDEAQDWVDRVQEAVQTLRPQPDDGWEVLQCLDSPRTSPLLGERPSASCQVFDWTFQVEVEPDALKESVVYMKVQKCWRRCMFSLSERELKCFLARGSDKALCNSYTANMVKDILPDTGLGSPSCFRLVTTKGSLQLQAESAAEAKAWRELVRAVFLELEEDEAGPFLREASFHIKPHIRDHLLFQYLLHIPTERGLDMQNLKCAGCHKQIGFHFGKVKLCGFSGLYYCDLCHQDEVSIVPSRIIHNWDLTERVVSRPAINFLKMVRNEPIFNLKSLNERLYRHTAAMSRITHSRERLRLLGEYLMSCRSGALQELSSSLDGRDYLLDCAHAYSVRDLQQISDGVFEGLLQSALEFAISHVYRCDLCSQRGFICQICNQDDIIYPFQFDTTTRCGECKTVFHKPCRTPAIRCPRCERRRKCQEQRGRM